MSRTNNLIEVNILSYNKLRTLVNNQPVQHLKEVPFGDYQLELDLVDEIYDYSESTGNCRCYSVYVDTVYAGYMVVLATEMLHHRGIMQALTDSFYIAPEYRSSGAFKALLQYVEQDLLDSGIRFFTLGLNPNMPHFDKLVYALTDNENYKLTEYSVTKEL